MDSIPRIAKVRDISGSYGFVRGHGPPSAVITMGGGVSRIVIRREEPVGAEHNTVPQIVSIEVAWIGVEDRMGWRRCERRKNP
jgi:hypothetical protein